MMMKGDGCAFCALRNLLLHCYVIDDGKKGAMKGCVLLARNEESRKMERSPLGERVQT